MKPKLRDEFLKREAERETQAHLKELARMYLPKEKRDELALADLGPQEDPEIARARAVNSDLIASVNGLNGAFVDIIDSVAGYKADLAITLQRLIECYNSVLL